MATIVESKAYFRKRWSEIGLEQDVLQAFELAGIDTITKYAFARVPPGQNLTQQELTEWFNEITGSDPPPGQVAQIRQLHFESHTLVIAQLKSQVESPVAETAQPKKIPQSERLSRMKRLKDELSGVLIENELEPSTSLLEYAAHLEQCDILRYIPVEKCQSRHFEMQHSKPKKSVEIDGSTLKISEGSQVPTQDASTAFEVQQALRRRGLALEFANLISWPVHERYVSYLFHQFTQEPPPGFSKITIAQILRADREAFNQASETCPHIRSHGDGTRPLDDVFRNIFQMHQVSFHLLPTVASKKIEKEPNKYHWAPYGGHDDSPGYLKGKGKGKKGKQKGGKGKQKGASYRQWEPPVPMALREGGGVANDPSGQAICFGYNMGVCKDAPDGAECPKGRHVCCKKGCFQLHPFVTAHKSSRA